MRSIRRMIRLLFRRRRVEADLDNELRACVEILAERYIEAGMSSDDALRAAKLELGGIEQVKETVREVRVGAALETLLSDLRVAFRTLWRERSFYALAIITAALGIGINTAVFSALYAVVLKHLPYDHSASLTIIWSQFESMGAPRAPGSGPEMAEIQRRNRLFEGIAGIWVGNDTVRGDRQPEQIKIAQVTSNFFDVLGAKPQLGRAFTPQDPTPRAPKAALISDGLWRRRFGSDPHIVGQPLRLGNYVATIVGVMPRGFRLYFPPDANVPGDVPVFVPFESGIAGRPRDLYFIRYIGRLKSGVGIRQAQDDLDAVARYLRANYAEYAKENLKLQVTGLQRDAVREVRPGLSILMAGAIFVLLIACVNVANLLLARAAVRRKEIALRSAIGASRGRIVRQLLAESLALGIVSGLGGAAIGWAGIRLINALNPEPLLRMGAVRLTPEVLFFVLAISFLSAMLFGVAPAFEASRVSLGDVMQDGGRGTRTQATAVTRNLLVAAEVMLGFVLLTGAGLMALSFYRLHQTSPGFDAAHVLTFEVQPRGPNVQALIQFVSDCERKIRDISGVQYVGAISHLPLDDYPNWYSPYHPEGLTDQEAKGLLADHRAITPGYFQAMSARLLEGRFFNDDDRARSKLVVIVDDLLARTTWPGRGAVGKRLTVEQFTPDGFRPALAEVVGVIGHIQHHSLTNTVRGQIYIPYPQSPREHLSFVVRTSGDPLALVEPVRRQLRAVNKDMALGKVLPMTAYVRRAAAPLDFNAVVAVIFGGVGLVLAAIGVYCVITYTVSQRTREFGIRLAVGAQSSTILRLVVREGLLLAAAGIAVGVGCALLLARYLQSLLFGVVVDDLRIYAAAAIVIVLASALACWVPGVRAARGSVMDALRLE